MPIINELAVISKFTRIQSILAKTYDLNEKSKIIDVIVHAEKLLDMVHTAFANFVDIKAILGIYFIYYREGCRRREPCSFFAEEPVTIRVYKAEFDPVPPMNDFSSGEFAANIRGIKARYDIDMDCKFISVDVTAEVILNLVEEKTIILEETLQNNEEEEVEEFDEIPLSSVAISKNYFGGDLRNYAITLEELSKAINHKLIEIEEEKRKLKKEIERMKEDLNNKNQLYLSLNEKCNRLSWDYSNQLEKLKIVEGKYLKEHRKVGLLEKENNKKMEEINYLSKERNDLLLNIEKSKSTIKDRMKQLFNKIK